ncbi:MAG: hypothetical protein CML16_01205 [Pusillimonas sp.]|nr:hypothetical protein [Pusillimonas sp.]
MILNCNLYSYFINIIIDFFITKEVITTIFSGIIMGLFLGIKFLFIKNYLLIFQNLYRLLSTFITIQLLI